MGAREQIREKAIQAGFDAIGFAAAAPVAAETALWFKEWLVEGRQAGMTYLEQYLETRLDPHHLLPEARTVLVVLCNYFRENPTESLPAGKIARYAGGSDYHKVMGKALKNLSAWIEETFPGTTTWYEVDTGPVLERYWAQEAGLGWTGKNTLLINQKFGSWTYLGIILTSLELPPDQSHPNHCGTCTRCLEACPTQALMAPGVLNSNRCISYWTIEHRGDFPPGRGADRQGWIFGCDECQSVCPWNRHPKETTHAEFHLSDLLQSITPETWKTMSREEWDQRTRGTALRRAGYEGLLRNCEAVLTSHPVPGEDPDSCFHGNDEE